MRYLIAYVLKGRGNKAVSMDFLTPDELRDYALSMIRGGHIELVETWRPHPKNGLELIGVYRP